MQNLPDMKQYPRRKGRRVPVQDAMMYRQMIFSLIYLMNTRPDIFFSVNTLRHVHPMVAKHAVRYLRGTVDYGIKYNEN